MSRSDEERITDIVEAAAEVSRVVANGKRAWDTDRLGRLAVERLLEIIGESARAMTPPGRDAFPEVPWDDVIGLRTLLAHRWVEDSLGGRNLLGDVADGSRHRASTISPFRRVLGAVVALATVVGWAIR